MMRPTILDGRGAVHIDRIVSECIENRTDPKVVAVRLEVASLLADVLDSTKI